MTYKPEKGSRQPVVLYDQDNKAIDVSGLEELSSVKIDTGKIAGDLKFVKDNQGRLYGQYGEDWIPVKVDSEGRPILASDVTVNAEGLVVDLGQIKQGPAGTEPWPVQLSGTNVPQETTILPRAIRRATTGAVQINPPAGLHVRGVAIVCRIYGVTGTFGETEGLDMETGTFAGAYPAYAGEFMSSGVRVKTTGGHAHIWLPGGTTVGDSQPLGGYVYKRSGSPFVRGYLSLYIDGTFTSEQGFDCEVKAIWQV